VFTRLTAGRVNVYVRSPDDPDGIQIQAAFTVIPTPSFETLISRLALNQSVHHCRPMMCWWRSRWVWVRLGLMSNSEL
jgi:hypothetical protein